MEGASLYGDGWRQGSLIRAALKVVVLDNDGSESVRESKHDLWLLANQDCDLNYIPTTNDSVLLELRAVHPRPKGHKIDGIRSKSVKLTDDLITYSDSPRVNVTPRALTALKKNHEVVMDESRAREVKTWLGLRYDRPAVPDPAIPIARTILGVLGPLENLDVRIRDTLVYFHDDLKHVNLFVVLRDNQNTDEVLAWLDDKIGDLSDKDIVVKTRYVHDSSQTPLSVLETYYSIYYAEHSLTANAP